MRVEETSSKSQFITDVGQKCVRRTTDSVGSWPYAWETRNLEPRKQKAKRSFSTYNTIELETMNNNKGKDRKILLSKKMPCTKQNVSECSLGSLFQYSFQNLNFSINLSSNHQPIIEDGSKDLASLFPSLNTLTSTTNTQTCFSFASYLQQICFLLLNNLCCWVERDEWSEVDWGWLMWVEWLREAVGGRRRSAAIKIRTLHNDAKKKKKKKLQPPQKTSKDSSKDSTPNLTRWRWTGGLPHRSEAWPNVPNPMARLAAAADLCQGLWSEAGWVAWHGCFFGKRRWVF